MKNKHVWAGHCCSRGWLEQESVQDILSQTRLRLGLFEDGLHNPSWNKRDRILEQLRKEKSLVAGFLNTRDGIRVGVTMRVDDASMGFRSPAQSFVTASTCMRSYSTALSPKTHDHKEKCATEWMKYLDEHGLIPDPGDELDWSGRGQHVEYEPSEEMQIPLATENEIGSGVNSIVESIVCRRIRLARKTVFCRNFPRRADAMKEVEHLQRLRHAHLVRLVGTYTLRRDLSILLYPVAEYNLAEFLPTLCCENPQVSRYLSTSYPDIRVRERLLRRLSLFTFFGCLSNALHFVHSNATKHMDIKPQNILVKKRTDLDLIHPLYEIYIADFGIARSYDTTSDAETSTPIGFTRAYAAPEVLSFEKRGFPADVFSLGCVFAEMLSAMEVWDAKTPNELKSIVHDLKTQPTGSASYATNAENVQHRLRMLRKFPVDSETAGIIHLTIQMLCSDPSHRPSSKQIADSIIVNGSLLHPDCYCCDIGPADFEPVDEDSASLTVEAQYRKTVNRKVWTEVANTRFSVQVDHRITSEKSVPRRFMGRLSALFTEPH